MVMVNLGTKIRLSKRKTKYISVFPNDVNTLGEVSASNKKQKKFKVHEKSLNYY